MTELEQRVEMLEGMLKSQAVLNAMMFKLILQKDESLRALIIEELRHALVSHDAASLPHLAGQISALRTLLQDQISRAGTNIRLVDPPSE